MPGKVTRSKLDAKAAVYADSDLMTHRLRHAGRVSARVHGVYGIYQTVLELKRGRRDWCTCPSEEVPCKHVRALRYTWSRRPKSFFDLERFLVTLGTRSKEDLINSIALLAERDPGVLGVLGVRGFEDLDEAQEEF